MDIRSVLSSRVGTPCDTLSGDHRKCLSARRPAQASAVSMTPQVCARAAAARCPRSCAGRGSA